MSKRKRLQIVKRNLLIAGLLAALLAGLSIVFRHQLRNYRQALFVAASGQGRTVRMRLLLAVGANINEPACSAPVCASPLVAAAWAGETDAVRLLLERDANVNSEAAHGVTALMGSAYHGDTEVVRLLLSKGADVNASDSEGITALQRAKQRGHQEVVKLLVNAGARE